MFTAQKQNDVNVCKNDKNKGGVGEVNTICGGVWVTGRVRLMFNSSMRFSENA